MSGKSPVIDIAGILTSAGEAKGWTTDVAVRALNNIAEESATRLQWEKGAGEDWGTFLRDGEFAGMISVSVCLGVTVEPEMLPLMRSNGVVEVIVVDTFQEPSMCCDLGILKKTFRYDHGWVKVVDPGCFSAEDLWWVTI